MREADTATHVLAFMDVRQAGRTVGLGGSGGGGGLGTGGGAGGEGARGGVGAGIGAGLGSTGVAPGAPEAKA